MRPQPIVPVHHETPVRLRGLSWHNIQANFAWQCGSVRVIQSSSHGWEHVSVSLEDRTPTWAEMEFVKRSFFFDHETAMQLHVPVAEHINKHPHCLHLWRPLGQTLPRPPNWMVG